MQVDTTVKNKKHHNNMKKINLRTIRLAASALILTGVIGSPIVASAAANTASTTINASVGASISVTTTATVSLSLTPTAGGVVSSASDTVTVNTNNATGYMLTLADGDANVNLSSGGNLIGAHSGTQASPTALGANTWGYAVANVGGFDSSYSAETNNTSSASKWAGMPVVGAPNQLKSTSNIATNDTTIVWYGVRANSAQPNGTYSDTVTYTATTN